MAPDGEAPRDVGLDAHGEKARHRRARDGEEHRRDRAGAEEGDHEKADEKHQRRAEVADEREGTDAYGGKDDEHEKVAPSVKLLERRRADVKVEHLDELRGLEGKAADGEPALRAVERVARENVQSQQRQREDRREGAQRLAAAQVAQPQAQQQEQHEGREDQHGLLEHVLRRGRGRHRHAQPREIKGDGLHLEAAAADKAHRPVAGPLEQDQHREAESDLHGLFVGRGEQMLQQKQQLEDRQLEERQRGGDAFACGGAFFLERAALFRAEILQTQVDRADLRRRARCELRALGTDRTAVHPHAAAREHVKEHPAPVVAPRQHGVRALDALAVDADVGRACAPDQVFPMRHVDGVAPEAGRGPGLGLIAGGEHRADAAQHDQQRQRDQQIFRGGEDIRKGQVHMRSPPFAIKSK